MPALPELQAEFVRALFEPHTPDVRRAIRAGRFPADRLIQVYRNNMLASLTEALAAIYPVAVRLVGREFFDHVAGRYIHAHPSRSGNLHDFGGAFAEFLVGFAPAATLPYLPDIARLEWAWHRAFHAADHAPLALPRLAEVAPAHYEQLHFHLHPSAQLLASRYPIVRIFAVNQPDYRGDDSVDLAEGGVRVIVVRPALEVEIEPLGAGDYALLTALAAGTALGPACERALVEDAGFDFSAALTRHVARGRLVDFDLIDK